MKNIFLLYGEEDFLINDEISNIIKKHPDAEITKYDLNETNINELLGSASMFSLFNDKKIIVGYNAYFLSSVIAKENINHNIDNLSKYINNQNPNTIVILVLYNDKLDKRKKIVKELQAKVNVKEFLKLKPNEVIKFTKNLFVKNNYEISSKALNMLLDRVGNNLYLMSSECNKLMLYKIDDKSINEQEIEEMIEKYDYDNIFALTDAVIKKDINTSLHLYYELLKRNEEPIKIIVLLANQFRLIYQVKRLFAKGFSETQIASNLGVHRYRVELANMVRIKGEQLLDYIELLAKLDENIKLGKVNKNVGLELFLLKL